MRVMTHSEENLDKTEAFLSLSLFKSSLSRETGALRHNSISPKSHSQVLFGLITVKAETVSREASSVTYKRFALQVQLSTGSCFNGKRVHCTGN